jgi:hypothetical protein
MKSTVCFSLQASSRTKVTPDLSDRGSWLRQRDLVLAQLRGVGVLAWKHQAMLSMAQLGQDFSRVEGKMFLYFLISGESSGKVTLESSGYSREVEEMTFRCLLPHAPELFFHREGRQVATSFFGTFIY